MLGADMDPSDELLAEPDRGKAVKRLGLGLGGLGGATPLLVEAW